MKRTVFLIGAVALAGCSVETASTAATTAAAKKQELEQGRKTMEHLQRQIGQAMEQAQRSQEDRENAAR